MLSSIMQRWIIKNLSQEQDYLKILFLDNFWRILVLNDILFFILLTYFKSFYFLSAKYTSVNLSKHRVQCNGKVYYKFNDFIPLKKSCGISFAWKKNQTSFEVLMKFYDSSRVNSGSVYISDFFFTQIFRFSDGLF